MHCIIMAGRRRSVEQGYEVVVKCLVDIDGPEKVPVVKLRIVDTIETSNISQLTSRPNTILLKNVNHKMI